MVKLNYIFEYLILEETETMVLQNRTKEGEACLHQEDVGEAGLVHHQEDTEIDILLEEGRDLDHRKSISFFVVKIFCR